MMEKLRSAMESCAVDSGAGLRLLFDEDLETFVRASAELLQSEADSPGREHLLKLLAASDQVVRRMCDPDFFSAEESAEFTRRLARVDPRIETKLVRMMPRPDSAAH